MNGLSKNQVSSFEIPSRRGSSGTANIIIPKDIDRNVFISECQKNSTITILTEQNERIDNVLVAENVWNFISFPNTPNELGSRVIWINIPKYNQPVVVAKINKQNEIELREEEEFLIKKEIKGKGVVELSLDPKNNAISINLNSFEDVGQLDIKVKANQKGVLNLESDSDIIISAPKITSFIKESIDVVIQDLETQETKTEIKYKLGEGLSYLDEFDNFIGVNSKNIQLKTTTEIILGDGKEPIVLAETCKKVLDKFIDLVSAATVSTSLGQMPLLNRQSISDLKNITDSFFSQLTKSD